MSRFYQIINSKRSQNYTLISMERNILSRKHVFRFVALTHLTNVQFAGPRILKGNSLVGPRTYRMFLDELKSWTYWRLASKSDFSWVYMETCWSWPDWWKLPRYRTKVQPWPWRDGMIQNNPWSAQHSQSIQPMLNQCWTSVHDAGPALIQHWVDLSRSSGDLILTRVGLSASGLGHVSSHLTPLDSSQPHPGISRIRSRFKLRYAMSTT